MPFGNAAIRLEGGLTTIKTFSLPRDFLMEWATLEHLHGLGVPHLITATPEHASLSLRMPTWQGGAVEDSLVKLTWPQKAALLRGTVECALSLLSVGWVHRDLKGEEGHWAEGMVEERATRMTPLAHPAFFPPLRLLLQPRTLSSVLIWAALQSSMLAWLLLLHRQGRRWRRSLTKMGWFTLTLPTCRT